MRPIEINFDKIPKDLTALEQWALWKYENETKVPYCANGSGLRASSTDKSTWRSFEFVAGVFDDGGYDGIFFVLSKSDPFTVIDLDHCISDDGVIANWADAEVKKYNSYAEFSPSMTGIHIWIRAKLPVGIKHRNGDFEIYDHSRFMSVTGWAYGN